MKLHMYVQRRFLTACAPSPKVNFPAHLNIQWTLGTLANTAFHSTYHPLSETNAFLSTLARAHPENVLLEVIGFSAEGRKIVAAAIKRPQLKKKKDKLKKKPRFVIMGTQHAREVSGVDFGWKRLE